MDLDRIIGDAHALELQAGPEQQKLSERYLIPKLNAVLERMAVFRQEVDDSYAPKIAKARQANTPGVYGEIQMRNYPIGFCKQIREGVLARMLTDPLIQDLVLKGLTLRRVFIFLKGIYFQNAIQLGNYYLDAANDTVFTNKPKLDWAPIDQLDFENLNSWSRFATVAKTYLKIEIYPNLLFPLAFPASPFFAIRPNGRLDFLIAQNQILCKDLGEHMHRTLTLLDDSEWMQRQLPEPYVQLLKRSCGGNLFEAFPLEFTPVTIEHIRNQIIPQFITLSEQPSKQSFKTVKSYFDLIDKSSKRLTALNLKPSPDQMTQLRTEQKIPPEVDSTASLSLD